MRGKREKRVVGDEPESNWLLKFRAKYCIAGGLTKATQGPAFGNPRQT